MKFFLKIFVASMALTVVSSAAPKKNGLSKFFKRLFFAGAACASCHA